MSTERMPCCGALTRVYSDAGRRVHNEGCEAMGTDMLPDPGWSDVLKAYVIKVTDHWVVGMIPMIFNDRVFISSHEEWRTSMTAAWCFEREGTPSPVVASIQTMAIAEEWDPETEREPEGYKKCAFDARNGSLL